MNRYAEQHDNSLNELLVSHSLRREELGAQTEQDDDAVEQALQQLKTDMEREQ